MCNMANILNNRPITKLSDDPTDPLPLTTNHPLMMRSTPELPPGKLVMGVYPGSDGLVRSVELKGQAGTYDRPIPSYACWKLQPRKLQPII
jgi:hypothetical protein